MNSEIYISTDVETDGPIPGPNSMLSLGAAAFKMIATGDRYALLDTFSMNLRPLIGAKPDPSTQAWWETQPRDVYEAARYNPEHPEVVIGKYIEWVKSFDGKPVFVGYPATFDFLFVYWYIRSFGFESPFNFSALDIKTYAMAMMKSEYRKSAVKDMPERWKKDLPAHTHLASDDAIEQGSLFMTMLQENLKS